MKLTARFAIAMIVLSIASPCWSKDQAARDRIEHLDQQLGELMEKNEFVAAAKLGQQTLELAEKTLGENDLQTATTLSHLGLILEKLGLYAQAESYDKRALAVRERQLPKTDPDLAISLNNLAFLYKEIGRYADAEPLMKRSVAIREANDPEDLAVANALNNLGLLYRDEKRYVEAEPLIKRGLAIAEKKLGPWDINVARSVNSLAALYGDMERYDEQKKLLERSLEIREKVLSPNDPALATALDNLASFYTEREGLFSNAEPLSKRALAIYRAAYGPFSSDVAITTNNLVSIYRHQRNLGEVEKLLTQTLNIYEKTAGPKHPSVANAASQLADFYFDKGDFTRATEFWRRSALITSERALEDANETARPLAVGGEKANIEFNIYFTSLLKAAFRAAQQDPKTEPALAREMFEIAQWVQNSEAALSLTNMAARGAKGSPTLESMIRDRESLVEIWRKVDETQTQLLSLSPEQRNTKADEDVAAKLADVVQRISAIDKKITADFPQYSSLASPAPITVETVQSLLGPNEALVLILDTDRLDKAPEELFVWVVTKTQVRWTSNAFSGPPIGTVTGRFFGEGVISVATDVKNPNIAGAVKALRCGLDYELWKQTGSDSCESLLDSPPESKISDPWPPFDEARSYSLYQALFGGSEDLIKGKQLLVVPSGPLAQLPFQVLVTSLPKGLTAGKYTYESLYLDVDLEDLTDEDRHHLNWTRHAGARITLLERSTPNPAESAGIRPDDILVKIEGKDVTTAADAEEKIRSHPSQTPLHLGIWRNGSVVNVTAILLGEQPEVGWKPFYLQRGAERSTPWFIRDHALSILPAASSLAALRKLARPSSATKPMIGFGNPLLNGRDKRYGALAKAARQHQACRELSAPIQTAAVNAQNARGGLNTIAIRDGLADVSLIRKAPPLPETADELCAVARDLDADQDDIYLGARASESEVKRLSEAGQLAQYRVIHFATHGVLPGELKGFAEPGLILTPPNTASDEDDGYLSASEIAGLKLDADWVILSACNTAAGGFKGADAFSGLARAFFYAKARSLLVSHWAVNSASTVKLITGAMRGLATDKTMGRAEAMQKSMLDLIDHGEQRETHPAYWAPFVVVGEGAATSTH